MRANIVILAIILFSSCTEDYRLHSLENQRVFTVEGCITDEEGPYRIKLAEYMPDWAGDTAGLKSFPVTDARVIITDDAGNTDELKPLWKEQIEAVEHQTVFGDIYFTYNLLAPTYQNDYERIPLPHLDGASARFYEGVYYTTSIVGVQGRTYTLTVECNGKTYTATDRMPYGTTLDSAVMLPNGVNIEGKDGGAIYVPHLNFRVPKEQENYFFFTYRWVGSNYDLVKNRPEYDFNRIVNDSDDNYWYEHFVVWSSPTTTA